MNPAADTQNPAEADWRLARHPAPRCNRQPVATRFCVPGLRVI